MRACIRRHPCARTKIWPVCSLRMCLRMCVCRRRRSRRHCCRLLLSLSSSSLSSSSFPPSSLSSSPSSIVVPPLGCRRAPPLFPPLVQLGVSNRIASACPSCPYGGRALDASPVASASPSCPYGGRALDRWWPPSPPRLAGFGIQGKGVTGVSCTEGAHMHACMVAVTAFAIVAASCCRVATAVSLSVPVTTICCVRRLVPFFCMSSDWLRLMPPTLMVTMTTTKTTTTTTTTTTTIHLHLPILELLLSPTVRALLSLVQSA